jgi:hypothetical protein
MLVLVVVSAGILAGCEVSESEDSSLQQALLAAVNPSHWVVITPANGSLSVSYTSDIVLKYNGGTLDPVIDVESIQITEEGGDLIVFTDLNSAITIDGDTVTINPTASTFPASGTWYFDMVISGFKDSTGNAIDTFTISNFKILSEPK